MKTQLISIGDEILTGQTVDTNSAFIAQQLNLIGIEIYECIAISDTKEHIIKSLDEALKNVELIIITGGLGPTNDDITKSVLCDYFDDKLEFKVDILNHIQKIFRKNDLEFLEVNRLQAMLPAKARIIKNELGTASGMWFRKNDKHIISLPGVPYEMIGLMEKLIPIFKKEFGLGDFYHRTILFQGIVESKLAKEIAEIEKDCSKNNIKLAYLPSPGIVKLRFTGTSQQKYQIEKFIHQIENDYRKWMFGEGDDKIETVLGELLKHKKKTIGTVESCTGGGIAKRITSVSGSSDYFMGSFLSYDNRIKRDIVGVDGVLIEKFGAVSQEVVEAMAINGRKKLGLDYCIASSGIAGPNGGSKEKPVGTVWIGIASKDKTYSKHFIFGQNRERNVELSIVYALNYLRRIILNLEIEE